MAVFMERHTPKTRANSSRPSSQTFHDDTAVARPGAKSKGPSHQDQRCANTRTVETVEVAAVELCESCGEDSSGTACQGYERRTKIDIVFEKVVTHVDAQIKRCPGAARRRGDAFPPTCPARCNTASASEAISCTCWSPRCSR